MKTLCEDCGCNRVHACHCIHTTHKSNCWLFGDVAYTTQLFFSAFYLIRANIKNITAQKNLLRVFAYCCAFRVHTTYTSNNRNKMENRDAKESGAIVGLCKLSLPIKKRSKKISCFLCFTYETPLWRKTKRGNTLCNKCGIRYKRGRICFSCFSTYKRKKNWDYLCDFCGHNVLKCKYCGTAQCIGQSRWLRASLHEFAGAAEEIICLNCKQNMLTECKI